ncbi:ferredoxin-fold anticodon-binding domain protein [Trifolium repens]|nr:ferredoxin-fold anticodon-binding domain protein [Trifolium repens]
MTRPLKSKKKRRKKCVGERGAEEGSKWLKHYCSDHQILLVGEGDFSFSLSLAKAFSSATNIVASSLDTYDDVIKKYKFAKSNLDKLKKLGACIFHGVDATKLQFDSYLKMKRFDRIIFNFPHAGFVRKEDDLLMIKMHKDLVYGFFKNARQMLVANGEIHVNHKMKPPYTHWNTEKLAEQSFLVLIECAKFKKKDYPGYSNKGGDGNRCDEPFPLGKCSTFKFTSIDAK